MPEEENQGEVQDQAERLINNLRPKLLDVTSRNPLISTKFSTRSNSYIRVVDELPDLLRHKLDEDQKIMQLISLPGLDEDPRDEQCARFLQALDEARQTDEDYLAAMNEDNHDGTDLEQGKQVAERKLKDCIREHLGMHSRQTLPDVCLAKHAQNNRILPEYDLPKPNEKYQDEKHKSDNIQTLLLPDDFVHKLNNLNTKYNASMQESGINVLHVVFGFVEWIDPDSPGKPLFAPLVLTPAGIQKENTPNGPKFSIQKLGDRTETNQAFAAMLGMRFQIDMLEYKGGSIEEYFAKFAQHSSTRLRWKVRRWVALGVFPYARMAMYHDLDTTQNAFHRNEIVSKLLGTSSKNGSAYFENDYEIDQPEIEKKVPYLVMDADSSQFSALVDIAKGHNLAIEGPPGTGKSQTIVNAIAAAIGDGKKVLFVAEKTAALEVVRSRLEAIGLGEFILSLQVDRSARKTVIDSVRDRMNMEVIPSSRDDDDYNREVKQFKKSRAELASYIDLLTTRFGETDFTVYDILGKGIATGEILVKVLWALGNITVDNVTVYNQSRINELKDLGILVENAWSGMVKAQPHWKGHSLLNVSWITVEEACRYAKIAADKYHATARGRESLVDLGIDSCITSCDLKALRQVVSSLPPAEAINTEFVDRVCQNNKLNSCITFFDKCKEFAAIQQRLMQVLVDVTDEDWLSRLRQIRELCEQSNFNTLDIAALKQQKIALLDLKKFAENVFTSTSFSVRELKKAKQLINQTPREVLALRTEATANSEASLLLEQDIEHGKKLHKQKSEIENLFSTVTNVSISDLSVNFNEITKSSLLSFFSQSYRQARIAYTSVSCRASFDKELAVKDIRLLIEYKESEKKFLEDSHILALFGSHFRGVDTKFCLFDQLLSYYKNVEEKFPGIRNREIRQFLKSANLDSLISFPEFNYDMDWEIFDDPESCINYIDQFLSNFDSAVEQLALLTSGLKAPASIRICSIGELELCVANYFRAKKILDENEEMKNLLGDRFNGAESAWRDFKNDMNAADAIISAQFNSDRVCNILARGTAGKCLEVIPAVIKSDADAESALKELSQYTRIDVSHFIGDRLHSEIAEFLDAASEDKRGLNAHSKWATACRDIRSSGFEWVVTSLIKNNVPLSGLGDILEAIIVRSLANEVENMHGGALANFRGEKLGKLRNQLAAADRKIIKLSCTQIRKKVCQLANPPSGVSTGLKSSRTDMSLINNEIAKERRFISIRDLTTRAGKALLELKPCWMMSPLAVAQYLPRGDQEIDFDLCVIDEASQMPPEDSIGALARSHQAVVVGDTNQLPPTNFFRTLVDDENFDEDEVVLNESILEMANAVYRPARRLRWHYRSRHSALIKFSNRRIYRDSLIVFPSANESKPEMGIYLERVQDGLYSSGTNIVEADAMIEATSIFMRTDSGRSLGLATMNQKQRDLLEEKMDYRLSQDQYMRDYVKKWEDKKDGLERFFIKNLENVQGDERDVIFIGTVYGREIPDGVVMQRFGPINHVSGKRRLNVLFTRAKEKIITFSSMTAKDIQADENTRPGAHMLKCWLEYSATGVIDAGNKTPREPDSDFERFVIDQIKSMGCEPVPQVGVKGYFIDIGVRHSQWPHGFIMGVECDGKTYHSSSSARDRDRLRQKVLEGLGWHLYRIWSTSWFSNPREEADKLRRAIDARLNHLRQQC